MFWQVVERYNGETKVLEVTDDEADALRIRDWYREQWSDYEAAKKCVYVVQAKVSFHPAS
jgi:hypothetical protein